MKQNTDPVFGFPSLVRFSWKPAREICQDFVSDSSKAKGPVVPCTWEQDDALADGNQNITAFFSSSSATAPKVKRVQYFDSRGISSVGDLL